MTWDPIRQPVDYVVLSGQRSPGVAELAGAASPRKWDVRKPHGGSGATVVYTGTDVSRFKLTLRLYTVQHWTDWHAWKALVTRPPAGERPRALDIRHPLLDDLGITSVVVEDLLQPRQTKDDEWTIEVHLLEYKPPVRALARPDGSDAAPTITDPVELRIQALTTRHQVNRIALGVSP